MLNSKKKKKKKKQTKLKVTILVYDKMSIYLSGELHP